MQLNKIMLSAILSLGAISVAHAAGDQGHGTVTFSGSIIDAPCSIALSDIDQTVDLGQVSNVALANGGSSKPASFEVKLEGCVLGTAKNVTTTFTGIEGANGLLGMTGAAKGASIALTNGDGSPLKLNTPSKKQVLQDGNNTMSFSAFLKGDGVKDAAVVPGDFKSVVNFTLAYQ
ncbi:MAG TPA: fimbria A protein [Serratia grimesii]|jgi:type 1 fimbria pilin|uniref:Fimbria A protein n=1 Tax=Serratia grimesii TaxID=82995 RepID=A0A9C7QVH9_9GAMM|nr:fimbrial protein [Serratia grimesii]CAI1626480.1 Fimbria A protein precursor [Serratia grimesii]HCK00082.1 fimbria A protein [Serratia grimesii]